MITTNITLRTVGNKSHAEAAGAAAIWLPARAITVTEGSSSFEPTLGGLAATEQTSSQANRGM